MKFADIERCFDYKPPTNSQVERIQEVRKRMRWLAIALLRNTPESAEQTLAWRKLEQFGYYAIAAIMREPQPERGGKSANERFELFGAIEGRLQPGERGKLANFLGIRLDDSPDPDNPEFADEVLTDEEKSEQAGG